MLKYSSINLVIYWILKIYIFERRGNCMYTDLKQIKEVAGALAEHHAAVMIGSGFSKNAEKIGVT